MSRHLRRLLRFFLLMALGGAGLVLAEDCGPLRDHVGTASVVVWAIGLVFFWNAWGDE